MDNGFTMIDKFFFKNFLHKSISSQNRKYLSEKKFTSLKYLELINKAHPFEVSTHISPSGFAFFKLLII